MFGKSLVLVLLGCVLVLAKPIQKNERSALQPNYDVNIGSWLQDAHQNIKQTFKRTVQPFEKTYYSLVEAGKNVQEYSKDNIEQLRSAFHEITDKGREQLSDIEVIVLTNTIGNLQSAVEYLSMRPPGTGIEQGQQGIYPNIQVGQHAAIKGNQNLQEIVGKKTNNANDKIDQLQNSVWSGINGAGQSMNNLGQKAQGMFNNQVENMKPNLDGGFTLGTGAFSQFRGGENVNRAKNDFLNPFNQFVSSGVSITDKLGGGAHGTINDGASGFFNNIGNSVQGAIGNGVENVKQWGSGAFKNGKSAFDEEVENVKGHSSQWGNGFGFVDGANKFGNQAQGAINDGIHGPFKNGKSAFDEEVENVKGHSSQWGNGFGFVDGANKFGNQVQGVVNNGIHGAQNQFNQYVPSTNGAGLYDDNAYDMRLLLDNIARQLAGAIAIHMNNVQQGLLQWESIVENFLANGKNKIEHQAQAVPGGMGNIKGNVDKLPNVAEGINNIHGSFGQLPNIGNIQGNVGPNVAEGVQGSFGQLPNFAAEGLNNIKGGLGQLPNLAAEGLNNIKGGLGQLPNFPGGVVNMEGAIGYMPNVDEGISAEQPVEDDGRFSQIGSKVGGNIGEGIDKFTNAVGSMWRNAAGMFGK